METRTIQELEQELKTEKCSTRRQTLLKSIWKLQESSDQVDAKTVPSPSLTTLSATADTAMPRMAS